MKEITITDPNTIAPCSYCKSPIVFKDAIMVAHKPHTLENGVFVYLYCSQICQEKHMVARQLAPIITP